MEGGWLFYIIIIIIIIMLTIIIVIIIIVIIIMLTIIIVIIIIISSSSSGIIIVMVMMMMMSRGAHWLDQCPIDHRYLSLCSRWKPMVSRGNYPAFFPETPTEMYRVLSIEFK